MDDFDPWEDYYTEEFPKQVFGLLNMIKYKIEIINEGQETAIAPILLIKIDDFIEKHNLNKEESLMDDSTNQGIPLGKASVENESGNQDPVQIYTNDLEDFSSFTDDQLKNWSFYHSPTEEAKIRHARICNACYEFLKVINENCPSGTDKAAAAGKVRDARMRANSAIACGGK